MWHLASILTTCVVLAVAGATKIDTFRLFLCAWSLDAAGVQPRQEDCVRV